MKIRMYHTVILMAVCNIQCLTGCRSQSECLMNINKKPTLQVLRLDGYLVYESSFYVLRNRTEDEYYLRKRILKIVSKWIEISGSSPHSFIVNRLSSIEGTHDEIEKFLKKLQVVTDRSSYKIYEYFDNDPESRDYGFLVVRKERVLLRLSESSSKLEFYDEDFKEKLAPQCLFIEPYE